MTTITCVEDMRRLYHRRVPRMFRDYAESGSYTEQTLAANRTDYGRLTLRQRVAVDISARSTAAVMAGQAVTMPVALAPVGLTGMQSADGEIKAARAAERFGVPFTLSTASICAIEDVARQVTKPFWFQLYVMRDLDFVHGLIERARAAECSALVLTVDLQIIGQRHRDIKNRLGAPPRLTLRNAPDILRRWRWLAGMAGTRRRTFGNIVGHAKGVTGNSSIAAWTNAQFDPSLNWDRIARLRERWGGRFIIKGIMEPEDALQAFRIGADAIVVSNHGGRQLDGAPSTIRALPAVVEAVGPGREVHVDGGICTGQDVLRALALGARGTYIGRAAVYGLGALGEAGVFQTLEILRKELDVSMALCGARSVDDLGPHNLYVPQDFAIPRRPG
jgi:L-lactate dehydrogenase (cytochrome)